MMPLPLLLLCFFLLSSVSTSFSGFSPRPFTNYPATFSSSEVKRIVQTFKRLPEVSDDRPSQGVVRFNYYTEAANEEMSWFLERIREKMGKDFDAEDVEFYLMHKFTPGGFFDYHVDTHPSGDSRQRTYNINVLLSEESEFEGGGLAVGNEDSGIKVGDCYSYPAAFPHCVTGITKGERFTLVLAVREARKEEEWVEWWNGVELEFKRIVEKGGKTVPAKIYWLFGEMLDRVSGREKDAERMFCESYARTEQSGEYVKVFRERGEEGTARGIEEALERLANQSN